jgi:hypothetical protein
MRHHVNDPSMHDERQRNRVVYTAGQLSTKGYVQRFFASGEGSSYFRVDPLLSEVQKGGDFDLFLNSVRSSQGGNDMPYDGSRHDVPSQPWDVSPYLARMGWPEHLKSYSWGSMIKAVGKLRTDDPIFLKKFPDLAHSYFKSLSSTDVMRFVHPANLDQLSHWKQYAILIIAGARIALIFGCFYSCILRQSFSLVKNSETRRTYARLAGRIVLSLLRRIISGENVNDPTMLNDTEVNAFVRFDINGEFEEDVERHMNELLTFSEELAEDDEEGSEDPDDLVEDDGDNSAEDDDENSEDDDDK